MSAAFTLASLLCLLSAPLLAPARPHRLPVRDTLAISARSTRGYWCPGKCNYLAYGFYSSSSLVSPRHTDSFCWIDQGILVSRHISQCNQESPGSPARQPRLIASVPAPSNAQSTRHAFSLCWCLPIEEFFDLFFRPDLNRLADCLLWPCLKYLDGQSTGWQHNGKDLSLVGPNA